MNDDKQPSPPRSGMSNNEVALELMRFIASTTGVGKATGGAGFSGKPPKSPEEQVDVLLQLFERCRGVLAKE